jgi:hypothetical protein
MLARGQTRSFGDVDSMSGLPKSGHAGAVVNTSQLAWQVIGKDADVYGLAEALRPDCYF